MSYKHHFKLADDVIVHLDTVVGSIVDPFIQSRYVGFVAIAATTVYELAIKDIFINFGMKKHKVLGTFTHSHFDRINGRIKTRVIKREYIPRFGEKYLKRFKRKLKDAERISLRNDGISILSSYNNVIAWRNEFTHEGKVPSTVTYDEIKKAYEAGKMVLDCLSKTMNR